MECRSATRDLFFLSSSCFVVVAVVSVVVVVVVVVIVVVVVAWLACVHRVSSTTLAEVVWPRTAAG